jgi:hypothetical protein
MTTATAPTTTERLLRRKVSELEQSAAQTSTTAMTMRE